MDATRLAMRRKSYGERKLASMYLPMASGGFGGQISNNRAELVNHYTGFPYIAITSIMDEIGCQQPQVAFRHESRRLREMKNKAALLRDTKSILEYAAFDAKLMPRHERVKALAPIRDDEELELAQRDHPLVRLLANPNGPDVSASFFRKMTMHWQIFGSAYVWCVPNRIPAADGNGYQVAEMWVLPSHWVWPVPGKTKLIDEYDVRPQAGYIPADQGGMAGFTWFPGVSGTRFTIPANQMIEINDPNPRDMIGGFSALNAVSRWVDVADNIDRSRVAQFHNAAMPGVVIEFDKDVLDPDPAQIERIRTDIYTRYVGVMRTGEPVILVPGMTMKPMTLPPKDMVYEGSADQMKGWLLAAYKVGQSIAGLAEQTTFSNVDGVRANFHMSNIRPKSILLGQIFSEKLGRKYEDFPLIFWPDATPENPEMKLKRCLEFTKANIMTVNQVRKEYGFEPMEWGDKPYTQIVADANIPDFGDVGRMLMPDDGSGTARASNVILDLQGAVAAGELDRESAIAHLVTVFGMTPEQADGVIPEVGSGVPAQDPVEQNGDTSDPGSISRLSDAADNFLRQPSRNGKHVKRLALR